MFKKAYFTVALLTVFVLTACATTQGPSTEAELPDVIKIGVIAPLTGGAAAYGQDIQAGAELYLSENPTINGVPVELIVEDGKCNGQDAANAAQKLINVDKVEVILGGQCSGETLAAAPIAEQNQVVLFSSLSSSPEITTAGEYIFRNYPSDEQVGKSMVEEVTKKYKTFSLLTEQTDYAQGFRGSIQKHLEAAGESDKLLLDEAFAVDNTDFRTLLTKVKESESEAIVLIAQTPITAGFAVKQAKELGVEAQIYGGDALPGPDFFDTAKDAAEGVKVVMVAEDSSRKGYKELTASIEAQASELFVAFAYDTANVVAKAIEKSGYDGTAIKDYLNGMGKFKGVASDITLDENGDNQVPAGVKVARDGEFVIE